MKIWSDAANFGTGGYINVDTPFPPERIHSQGAPPPLGDAVAGRLSDSFQTVRAWIDRVVPNMYEQPSQTMQKMNALEGAQIGKMTFDAIGKPLQHGLVRSIKAVHGSPHKFSKFSDEAMGSGEGAQAFGTGHYSGENVSALDEWYRRRLTDKTNINSPLDAGDAWKRQYGYDKYDKLQNMILGDMPLGSSPASVRRATTDTLHDAYRMAVQGKKYGVEFGDELIDDMSRLLNAKNPGYTYQLNLKPDQADLLHFDELVADHPKGLLAKIEETTDLGEFWDMADSEFTNPDGGHLHKYLRQIYGKEGTTNVLREAGIPGHSFTGQAGKGDPNYVIYDPADIEIVRRIRGGLDSPSPNARQSLLDYVGKGLLNE